MQALGLAPMAPALGVGNLLLDGAVELSRLELGAIACRRGSLEAQINAHHCLGRGSLSHGVLHRHAQPPVPDRILGKAAALPVNPVEPLLLEDPKGRAREADALAFELQLHGLERYPPEGAPSTPTDPPPELGFSGLVTLGRKLGIDPLDRVRADVIKLPGRPGG